MSTVVEPNWLTNKIKDDEIRKYLTGGADFIPDAEIENHLALRLMRDVRRPLSAGG